MKNNNKSKKIFILFNLSTNAPNAFEIKIGNVLNDMFNKTFIETSSIQPQEDYITEHHLRAKPIDIEQFENYHKLKQINDFLGENYLSFIMFSLVFFEIIDSIKHFLEKKEFLFSINIFNIFYFFQ